MKTCPKCNQIVSDTAKFCGKCGFNIKKYEEENIASERFCTECGAKMPANMSFCTECGTNLNDAGNGAPESFVTLGSLDFCALQGEAQTQLNENELSAFEFEKMSNGKYVIKKLKNNSELIIVVPNCVQMIESNAFENSSIIDITLPEGLIKIGTRAFANCKDLEKINMPSTLRIVEDEAFLDCVQLNIEECNGVRYGKDALIGTLTHIKKENERKRKEEEDRKRAEKEKQEKERIEAEKRKYTAGLKFKKVDEGYAVTGYSGKEVDFLIPEIYQDLPVVQISSRVFDNAIKSITIPKTVKYIAQDFAGPCSKFDMYYMGDLKGWLDISFCEHETRVLIWESGHEANLYFKNELVTEIIIPDSITEIHYYAFTNCSSLTSIVIPDSVKTIGKNAFQYCNSLANIVIPNSVTSIGNYAFQHCTSLRSIRLSKSVTDIGGDAFSDCYFLAKIELSKELASKLVSANYSQRRVPFRNAIKHYTNAEIIEY